MRFGTFYSNTLKKKVKQINKLQAKNLFMSGQPFYLQSCKLHFDCVWQNPAKIERDYIQYEGYTFEQIVDLYEFYNCDSERGMYPSFYIEL